MRILGNPLILLIIQFSLVLCYKYSLWFPWGDMLHSTLIGTERGSQTSRSTTVTVLQRSLFERSTRFTVWLLGVESSIAKVIPPPLKCPSQNTQERMCPFGVDWRWLLKIILLLILSLLILKIASLTHFFANLALLEGKFDMPALFLAICVCTRIHCLSSVLLVVNYWLCFL